MDELDNPDTIIEAVRTWQQTGAVHPLTCGNDSRHRILQPVREGDVVVLRCSDCEYRQTWIPEVVIKFGKAKGPRD